MSLADLVPLAQSMKIKRGAEGNTVWHMRWVNKNRDKWNAYRRAWYRRQKEKAK